MINKVILLGHIGKDPEVRVFENGNKVANFSLATTESYKKDGEWTDETEWHNIVVYGNTATYAEKYIKKGALVSAIGKKRTRSYDSKGVTKYVCEIICRELSIESKKVDNVEGDSSDIDEPPF